MIPLIDHLSLELKRKLQGLRREIDRLEARDFPSDAPKRVCSFMRELLNIIERVIPRLPRAEANALDRARKLDMLIREIGSDLRYVERSAVQNTPWSMVECLEDFFRKAIGIPVASVFLVRPKWHYNYSIKGDLNQHYRKELVGVVDSEDEKSNLPQDSIYVVSFPRIERLNATLHCLLGHEMGHILSSEWMRKNWKSIWAQTQGEVRARLAGHKPIEDFSHDEWLAIVLVAWRMLKGGLKEIVADLVGVHLLGPAAVLASFEWGMTEGMDKPPTAPNYYPPWRLRIKHTLGSVAADVELLENGQIHLLASASNGGTAQAGKDAIAAWVAKIREEGDLAVAPELVKGNGEMRAIIESVSKAIENVVPEIREWIQTERLSRSGLKYSLERDSGQIPDLVDMLRSGLPPAQSGVWPDTVRADFRTILNAAWLHRLLRISGCEAGDASDPEPQRMADLLTLKAIECSYVQKFFDERFPGVSAQ